MRINKPVDLTDLEAYFAGDLPTERMHEIDEILNKGGLTDLLLKLESSSNQWGQAESFSEALERINAQGAVLKHLQPARRAALVALMGTLALLGWFGKKK